MTGTEVTLPRCSGCGHPVETSYCTMCGTGLTPQQERQRLAYFDARRQPVAILNTSIVTADGEYRQRTISLEAARDLIGDGEILSAVGHESTAEILTSLLGRAIPVNRIAFVQQPGQKALVFKLDGRPPEGRILSAAEIEAAGYTFRLLERTA